MVLPAKVVLSTCFGEDCLFLAKITFFLILYIFVDFHESVHKRFQIFYPEHIFYPKFKKEKRLTELSKLMTETQTDNVYRLLLNVC